MLCVNSVIQHKDAGYFVHIIQKDNGYHVNRILRILYNDTT